METANFRCGHCGNAIGVEAQFLGQQVRCPHCQQVVIAPRSENHGEAEAPSTPTPPPEMPPAIPQQDADLPHSFKPPEITPASERESIFSAPELDSEGLFDEPAPRVEMPPEPAPAVEAAVESMAASVTTADEPTAPWPALAVPDSTAGEPGPPSSPFATGQAVAVSEAESLLGGAALAAESATPLSASSLPTPTVYQPKKRPWLMPLLIVPLISYSVLATLAAAILYREKQNQVHPLEAIPDQGDQTGAKRQKAAIRWPDPDQPLPAKLKIHLGESIALGDLEVIPERVARRKIEYAIGKSDRKEESGEACLVLELRLKNVSSDVVFKPMDPFFVRQWKPKMGGLMPYSYLSIGAQRFFGGPLSTDQFRNLHMVLVGQNVDRSLNPGEEMKTYICTDPEDPLEKALSQQSKNNEFLWRVQVRRGLVKVGQREIPATAVVGVVFSKGDIH